VEATRWSLRSRSLPVLAPSQRRPSGTRSQPRPSSRRPGTSRPWPPPRRPSTRSRDRRRAVDVGPAGVRDELDRASRATATSGSGVRKAAERRL